MEKDSLPQRSMGSMGGARAAIFWGLAALAPPMTSGHAGSGLWPAHAEPIRAPISAISEIGG